MEQVVSPIEISLSGMDVEWQRLTIIAENIANANTTRTGLGQPYAAQRLVSGPKVGFEQILSNHASPAGVMVYGVETTNAEARRVYQPDHPHADDQGYVEFPAIDHAAEMTLLIKTARAYEANLTVLNLGRQMYAKAMELGRRG